MGLARVALLLAAVVVVIAYLALVALAPSQRTPLRWSGVVRALVLAAGAVLVSLVAARTRGWTLLALWPAACLALLAVGYAGAGAAVWLKRHGRIAWPAALLLLPYRLPLALLRVVQARREPQARAEVIPGLWIGRLPDDATAEAWMEDFPGVLDLTCEHSAPRPLRVQPRYVNLPLLEGVEPSMAELSAGADALARLHREGMTLVLCGRGRSRSAAVIAAYLLRRGTVASVEEALRLLHAVRPQARLRPGVRAALQGLASPVPGTASSTP